LGDYKIAKTRIYLPECFAQPPRIKPDRTVFFINNLKSSIALFEKALKLFREAGDRAKEAVTLRSIRGVYSDLGEQQKALKLASAAALRAAQLEMIEDDKWKSPYYWAAFTLQGEWK
jgi:CHAT domain